MMRPVKSESASVKPSTGNDSAAPAFASIGRKFAASFGISGTSCHARTAPAMPANTLTSTLSSTKSRNTLAREAPIAIRNAISRRRPLKRTSRRFATLLHAISRTNPTAASNVPNAGRRSPFTSSGSGLKNVVRSASILSGKLRLVALLQRTKCGARLIVADAWLQPADHP